MSVITIRPGDSIEQDEWAWRVYEFDFDEENLPTGVTITTTPPYVRVEPIKPRTASNMVIDEESLTAGARKVQFRIHGGDNGANYLCSCQITTSESPYQIKDPSFTILIRNQ